MLIFYKNISIRRYKLPKTASEYVPLSNPSEENATRTNSSRGVLGCSCDCRLTLDETDDAISFDRIKNILGHRWSNLRVICVDCNRRSKQQDEKHM
jgi:hypothetical protein